MSTCEEIRERFGLLLDNELQADERLLIASHLAQCSNCQRALETEREFVETIRAARTNHVASSELRERVSNVLEQSSPTPVTVANPSRSRMTVGLAIAASFLVLLLPVLIWRVVNREDANPINRASNFALMAAETHLRVTRGQLPLEMESHQPTEISNWFLNKVNFSVKLPNYQESSGQDKLYTLEGARLVNFSDDYAAYVAYEMKSRPISLVITSDPGAKPTGGEEIAAKGLMFHYNAIQGLKVITWSDRGLTYALVSDLEERGQQSCIVCHQGTKDREFIEQLKPKT
jgi:anti-sigma factor RsiW